MSDGFSHLVSVLEHRYDFQSARTMAREALVAAGLKEQDKYSKDDLQKFVDGLSSVGSNLDGIYSQLGVSPSGAPAPAAPEPAPAKADDKKADDKKADAKDDKADAKDDKKSDAKDDKASAKDDKKDDKASAKDDKKDDDKGGKKK